MADFVAVLRNAIDGLNDNRPAIRQRIYERARLTLTTRLELVDPPPEAVVERHKRVLEDAIAEVESAYREQPAEPVPEPPDISDYTDKAHPRRGVALQIEEEGLETPQAGMSEVGPQNVGDINGPPNGAGLNSLHLARFEVRSEANVLAYDQPFPEPSFSSRAEEIESIDIGQISLSCVQEIAWANSSLCGVCKKWALCIDQTHCWHREGPANAVVLRQQP
jgi:hypothetical protein